MCVAGALQASEQPARVQQAAAPSSVVVQGVKDPSEWKRAESPHFIVYSDTSRADVTSLLNNLERLDYILRVYLRDYVQVPAAERKLTFYYHKRMGGFHDIATGPPTEAVGLYNSCPTAVQGFGVHIDPIAQLNSAQLDKAALNESQSYIFEAYTRHFLYRYTDIRAPSSFIDGMAKYFSVLRFSDTQMVLGRTPATVGRYLNFLAEGHSTSLNYRQALERADWHATGYVGNGYAGPDGVVLEYQAKSWLLMHYMLSGAEERKRMADYLDLVHGDTPAVAAFEQAFGMQASELDRAMWRYRRKALVLRSDFPIPATPPIALRVMSRAEGEVVLASAQLKSCPDRPTGEALLGTLSRQFGKNTKNEFVLMTMSRAQIDWGNPDDAVGPLTALLSAQPQHAEALQLLGMAHLRLAAAQQGPAKDAQLDAARRYLTQARALDPASSEAAYALFKAELGDHATPSPLALSSAIAAWNNAREVSSLARTAALAYAYDGQTDRTASILALLAKNSEDATSAAWAKEWRQRLAGGVKRADLVAELRRGDAAPAFKEWTVAASDTMRIIECNAGLEQARRVIETLPPDVRAAIPWRCF